MAHDAAPYASRGYHVCINQSVNSTNMIKDQFLYFAQYPSKEGIRAILTNGSSEFPGYNDLAETINNLPQRTCEL